MSSLLHRTRRTILTAAAAVSIVLCAAVAGAAATPQEMYAAALAREQAVRTTLAQQNTETPPSVSDVRAVVAAYQEIVRLYPASGYSDNALWQAGRLAIDAFIKFGQERDKNTGIRLLRLLTTEYPTSTLVKQVPEQLARVDATLAAPQPTPASAAAPQPAVQQKLTTIREIRRQVLSDAVRVTIEIDREVTFHDERIQDPVRVFIDLPSTRAAPALVDKTLRFDGDNDIVRQIRIGRHAETTTRVVLDAANVSSYSVYPLYDPYRLVIDCVRAPTPSDPGVAGDSHLQPTVAASGVKTALNPVVPAIAAHPAPPAAPLPDVLPAPAPATPPARNVGGGYSLARQLGLSVSRIVIDPGHGGHDPGAQGKSIDEAELVLDIALRVEKLLQKTPGTEVILTRRSDEFVSLQQRTAIANREGADLFLSIHANASGNPAAHGIETYFLNFASNMTAASVAARENAASGQAMNALPDFLKTIALNNKLDESKDFATEVQTSLIERLRKSNKTVKDLGVKQAPFIVLIGAAMPSVLAEISFVTNAPEAKLLRGDAYRQRIAEALAGAIAKYQKSLKNVTTLAHQ
jgi:N-acetylmuramoyl-L-alanine amidase